jgi:hypothetical protein
VARRVERPPPSRIDLFQGMEVLGTSPLAARSSNLRTNSQRLVPLVISLAIHALAVWTLFWTWPSSLAPPQRDDVYDQFIAPHKTAIVWYHLHKLPDISSERGPDLPRRPAALRVDKNVVISHSRPAPPKTQVIRQPDEVPLPKPPVPAVNMIAVKKGSPTLPPLPEPPPPVLIGRAETTIAIELPKAPPKRFVPPEPVSAPRTQARVPAQIAEPEAAAVSSGGAKGADDVSALFLSLLPGRGSVPPPGRSDVSAAPPSDGPAGESRGSGIQIAGVTVHPGIEPPKATPPALKPPYVATSVAPLQTTFSAPLPPSSRTIPQSIEARFKGRVVYAMIIPMKRVPGYAGDWIIWFAEHDPPEGTGPSTRMRAPLPIRKSVGQEAKDLSFPAERVQLSALIDKLGRVGSIAVLIGGTAPVNQALITDLTSWEFLPALRNREPVDVDVVVEISYASGNLTAR